MPCARRRPGTPLGWSDEVACVPMTACSIAKADIWQVSRVNVWFVGVLLAVLLLVTWLPAVPLFLVEVFYR